MGAEVLAAVRAALGSRATAWRLPRPEGLHLTLVFLGDQPRRRLASIAAGFDRALGGAPAPRLVLAGAGAFPRRGSERVLWLGCREGADAGRLAELHRRSLGAARGLGIDLGAEERRAYRPHVTVARPRRPPGRAPGRFFDLDLERELNPRRAVLFESRRVDRGPPVYEPLHGVDLGD